MLVRLSSVSRPPCTMPKRLCSVGRECAAMQRSIQRVVLCVASSNLCTHDVADETTQCHDALQGRLILLLAWHVLDAGTRCSHKPHQVGAHLSGVVLTLDTTSSRAIMMSAPGKQQDAQMGCAMLRQLTCIVRLASSAWQGIPSLQRAIMRMWRCWTHLACSGRPWSAQG